MNAFDLWVEEHKTSLMIEFIQSDDRRLSEMVSYLNELPRVSPLDYDKPEVMETYITAKLYSQFTSFCWQRWNERETK